MSIEGISWREDYDRNPHRLDNSSCYLCGPIDASVDFGKGWRDKITPFLENMLITVLDPKKKPKKMGNLPGEKDEQVLDRRKLLENGEYDELTKQVKLIRHIDLRLVDKADFLLVNLDLNTPMCGTWEEIFTANREKKPIIIVCEKRKIPAWLFGCLPHELFFDDFEQAKKYIEYIHNSPEIDTINNRWVFF